MNILKNNFYNENFVDRKLDEEIVSAMNDKGRVITEVKKFHTKKSTSMYGVVAEPKDFKSIQEVTELCYEVDEKIF